MAYDELINRYSSAYGLDPAMMRAFMRVESGGDPNARTGSYRGLFQLGPSEFQRYGGGGNIYDAEANTRAAAAKLAAEVASYKRNYGRAPTAADLYLTHQQGEGGYAAHMANPSAPAWRNMYSTAEGQQKGPEWAKRAIWGNVPADVRAQYPGGVENMTSQQFTDLWRNKIARSGGGENVGPTIGANPGDETFQRLWMALNGKQLQPGVGTPVSQAAGPIAPGGGGTASGGTGAPVMQQMAPGNLTAPDAMKRKLAEAMMMAGMSKASSAKGPWEALGAIAQMAAGQYQSGRASQEERDYRTKLGQALSGASDPQMLAATLLSSGDPEFIKEGVAMRLKMLKGADPETQAKIMKLMAETEKARAETQRSGPESAARLAKLEAETNKATAEMPLSAAHLKKLDAETRKIEAGLSGDNLNLDREKYVKSLREEWSKAAQPHRDLVSTYDRVRSGLAAETGAGDISAIYGYMKMLDPGSVVREGEFATAQNSAGVPEYVRSIYNQAMTGQRLTPNQRKDFLDRSGEIVQTSQSRLNEARKSYQGILARQKIPESDVFVNWGAANPPSAAPGGAAAPAQPGAAAGPWMRYQNGEQPGAAPNAARALPPGTLREENAAIDRFLQPTISDIEALLPQAGNAQAFKDFETRFNLPSGGARAMLQDYIKRSAPSAPLMR